MRAIVTGVVALGLAWCVYAASPYYVLYRLGQAVEEGDVAGIAARVNVRAVRFSLARQLAADVAAAKGFGGIATPEAELAAGSAIVLASPLLDAYAAPEGLARLLRKTPRGAPDGDVFGRDGVTLDDLDDFLSASTWRGFRNLYVSLPPGQPLETRYRLQLRLGGLRWRLVSLELPSEIRRSIVDGMLAGR